MATISKQHILHSSDEGAVLDDGRSTGGEAEHGHVRPSDIAVGVVIGRASEYFDFFVYGIASVLVFPSIFFPFEPRLQGTLYSFVIFALAFVARPFGSLIFMEVQRRFGRAVKLTGALFLLGISTAGIAFLPTYADLGAAAIVLLSILRLGQGLALGGSWDGLPSLLAMNAPPERRGWYAMVGQLGAPLGFALAGGLFSFLLANVSTVDFLDWGWRYPFYVAFAINVVALFARLQLVSTSEFTRMLEAKALEPANVMEITFSQGLNILVGALAALASYALFHLVTVFPLSWILIYSTRPIEGFLHVQLFGAGLAAIGIVASGWIADRIGRKRTLGTLATLIAVYSGFVPTLLNGGVLEQNVFILLGFTLLGLSYGQAAGAVTANFAAKYRYTGAALTADLAWLLGAAFAPLVVLGLSSRFGLAAISIYLLSGAACTLGALQYNRAVESRE